MTYEEIKKMIEERFGCSELFHNGFDYCARIYSKNGKKILETTNGEKWNTDSEHPIAIAVSRFNDYEETDETIEPFEEVEPNKEVEV